MKWDECVRGAAASVQESVAMLEQLRVDLTSAARSLAATPVPVLAAILTLAVAVGVNLAMFGLCLLYTSDAADE